MAKRFLVVLLAIILLSATGCMDPIEGSAERQIIENATESVASSFPTPSISPSPDPSPEPPEDSPTAEITDAKADAATLDEAELTPDELRELAFGAVLTARNPMHYRNLKGLNDEVVFGAYTGLYSSYGVYDRATALETLDWLRDEGHRGEYHTVLDYMSNLEFDEITEFELEILAPVMNACGVLYEALVNDYGYTEKEIEGVDSVTAWDMDRLVTVARWCYSSGYIAEAEAWEYIGFAAETAVREYHSWRGYFAGVLLGRALWSMDQEFSEQNREVADALLKTADSIYNQVPFDPPVGERKASRVYETYEEKQAEFYGGRTFGVSGLDVLAAFEEGLSDDFKVTVNQDLLSVSTIGKEHNHYFSVREAANAEVNYAYLSLTIFDNRTLEEAIADTLAECERISVILGTSPDAMAKAFDPDLMEVTETVVNTGTIKNSIVVNAEMTIETGGVKYKAQYAIVDGKLLSVTATVSKW